MQRVVAVWGLQRGSLCYTRIYCESYNSEIICVVKFVNKITFYSDCTQRRAPPPPCPCGAGSSNRITFTPLKRAQPIYSQKYIWTYIGSNTDFTNNDIWCMCLADSNTFGPSVFLDRILISEIIIKIIYFYFQKHKSFIYENRIFWNQKNRFFFSEMGINPLGPL